MLKTDGLAPLGGRRPPYLAHPGAAPAVVRPDPGNLTEWLAYIGRVHHQTVSLGLDRTAKVRDILRLDPPFPIITVGGTNGKGSTCAMLEAMLTAAGYRVGCYTSPHILHFRERVRINRSPVADREYVDAFARTDSARGQIPLTYFEFATLAAMQIFIAAQIDVAIMEVGLGGRLDAVNVFDPDCAVVTSIALDHTDYLGTTREQIGFEKAGIFRAERPAVCGEPDAPSSLRQYAHEVGANFIQVTEGFGFIPGASRWQYWCESGKPLDLPRPALVGEYQLRNAATAITALTALGDKLSVTGDHIAQGLTGVTLPGRFEVVQNEPFIVLDVAHNPEAADALARNLGREAPRGRTFAVFAMLGDKDIGAVVRALADQVDVWLIASIAEDRGAPATRIEQELRQATVSPEKISSFETASEAYAAAMDRASDRDRIVVFGSFHTVAAVQRLRAG